MAATMRLKAKFLQSSVSEFTWVNQVLGLGLDDMEIENEEQ